MKWRCGFSGALIWIHGFVLFSAFCLASGKLISDREILIEFKNSVSDLTGILSSWNSNVSDHCSWYGVSCNSKSRVLEINITGGNNSCSSLVQKFPFYGFGLRRNRACGNCSSGTLVGKLTSLIGRLSELRVLSLPFNEFSGEIPIEVWGLENLEVLDLEGNLFTGKLPRQFKGLRKLQVLNLGLNRIEGEIPISLLKCKDLYLSYNQLTEIGYISDEYGIQCRNLEHLDLSGNLLIGEIPRGLGKCRQLRTLQLYANKFDGGIPRELGQLQKLEVLDVSRNNLSGTLPIELGNCVELSVLVLSNLFDPLSDTSIPSASENNHFHGSVPMEITTLPKLKVVWAPRTMLQGKIPSNWGKCDSLEMVNLAENFFHGDLSGAFGGCKNLHFLNLSSNRLTGELDEKLLVPCMTIFDASKNSLSGSIPNFNDNICPHKYSFNADELSSVYIFFFTPQSVGNLGSLVLLDLSKNKLQGRIPASLAQFKHLKYLSLSGNNLTGVIPSSFALLRSLEVLALSSNSLTGEIPQSLMKLRNLTVLIKDNNLSRQIPSGFSNLTSLSIFNASWNNLSEPLSLKNDVMNHFHHFARLLSESDLNGSIGYSLNDEASTGNVTSSMKSGLTIIEIASVVSASAIFSVLLALIVLYFYTRKWAPNSRVRVSESREITVFTDIGVPLTYDSIVRSTGFFNANNCIGYGGFGATYKAEINSQTLLAVKKLSVGRFQGVQQFHAEIKTLETVRHPNLVKLIGYHASETEMFLIYNYLPGGNLEKFIQEKSEKTFDWKVLHKIALHTAKALAYLHDQCRVLHRDVKPSNILLDNNLNAYLSDFGLARLLGTSETHATTGVAGTFGYVAPEYALTCRVSEKSDVYSYGVVLLELISDKKALDPSFSSQEDGFNIVSWACLLLRNGRAKEVFKTGLWNSGPQDKLVDTLHLAVMCTVESLTIRPTMKQVAQRLIQLQAS